MTEWHAIKSKRGAEDRALIGIEAAGIQAFYPVERIRTHASGPPLPRSLPSMKPLASYPRDRKIITRPVFPGYLFARCEPSRDIPRLLEIDGVEDVLRPGGRLARVPDRAIEAIRQAQDMGAFDHSRSPSGFLTGDNVRVMGGPFAGLIARIRSAKSKHRIEVVVDFVHKITVGIDKLEKISA